MLYGQTYGVAKIGRSFPDLAAFSGWVVERSGRTASEIAEKGRLTRGAVTVSDLKNGRNPQWETLDRFARGAGYRGALEMFTSGGDAQTAKVLRVWRGLPDDEARADFLLAIRATRDATEESSST
jgi:hypothetical protein